MSAVDVVVAVRVTVPCDEDLEVGPETLELIAEQLREDPAPALEAITPAGVLDVFVRGWAEE